MLPASTCLRCRRSTLNICTKLAHLRADRCRTLVLCMLNEREPLVVALAVFTVAVRENVRVLYTKKSRAWFSCASVCVCVSVQLVVALQC